MGLYTVLDKMKVTTFISVYDYIGYFYKLRLDNADVACRRAGAGRWSKYDPGIVRRMLLVA